MDMVTASHLLVSSTTPTGPGWVNYLIVALAGGIGYAAYRSIKKNRSWSNFVKDFAWGATGILLLTFVLSYFFHVQPFLIDS